MKSIENTRDIISSSLWKLSYNLAEELPSKILIVIMYWVSPVSGSQVLRGRRILALGGGFDLALLTYCTLYMVEGGFRNSYVKILTLHTLIGRAPGREWAKIGGLPVKWDTCDVFSRCGYPSTECTKCCDVCQQWVLTLDT